MWSIIFGKDWIAFFKKGNDDYFFKDFRELSFRKHKFLISVTAINEIMIIIYKKVELK